MRREQDRPAGLLELLDEIPQLPPRLRIEPGRRLVEKQQIGIADERAGERQPLLLPARQRRRLATAASPRAARAPITSSGDGTAIEEAAEQSQRFLDGQLVGQLRLLQLDAEPLSQRLTRRSPIAGRAPRRRRSPAPSALRRSQSSSSCRRRSARASRSIRRRGRSRSIPSTATTSLNACEDWRLVRRRRWSSGDARSDPSSDERRIQMRSETRCRYIQASISQKTASVHAPAEPARTLDRELERSRPKWITDEPRQVVRSRRAR